MVWTSGGGYRLAHSLETLFGQLVAAHPGQQWQNDGGTGTIGDAAHRSQGSASDHNPWLNGVVRALDVSSRNSDSPDCEALFQMVNRMYAAHDSRVWPNGYAIFRGRITDWDHPGGYHAQQGDPHNDHLHISVSQTSAGYDSRAPWPLAGGVSHPPAPGGGLRRAWPGYMPAGHYFGLITGPNQSHGGYNANERPDVAAIQQRLQALGYAPKTAGWADGKFEQPTVNAVAAWQHAHVPGTQFYGQVWHDDWTRLFTY